MNDKASVSKELNAKHTKILEGLLKLPQNRECADCRNKGPRWASVNLGAFICMQCSGIHRSLGVHISKLGKCTPEVHTCMKILGTSLSFYILWRNFWTQNFMVRSATLDTWLPEQVAFMESMGNEKANSYWEANLPPNCDRFDIANFIRAKYEERRWVANNTAQPMRSPDEICGTFNAVKNEGSAPRRTRNLSLDEEVLTKHVAQVAFPVAKARGGSVDMTNMIVTSPPPNFPQQKVESHTSRNSLSGSLDLFNLPCIHDVKKDCSSVTPPNWATFDCKIFIKMLR